MTETIKKTAQSAVAALKAAGADVLVAGSSVFGAKNGFDAAIKAIREDA